MVGYIGLIIKSIDYLESEKIVTLLTEEGIKSVTIRGAQKLTSHTFNLAKELSLIELEQRGKYLVNGRIVKNYSRDLTSLDKINSCLLIQELLYTFREHVNDYKTCFKFALDVLNSLESNVDPLFLSTMFRVKFLYLLGIGPSFSKCVNCGKNNDLVYFSVNDGGVKCRSCADSKDIPVPLSDIETLKYMYRTKFDDLVSCDTSSYDLVMSNKVIDALYESFLDFKSNTNKVFNKINR